MTHEKLFHRPIAVSVGCEIASISEALDFLTDWNPTRRGDPYDAAVKACEFAEAGYMTTEQARRAFLTFAEDAGILCSGFDYSIAARAVTRSYGGFAS